MGYVVSWYADARDLRYGSPTASTFATLSEAAAFARDRRALVASVRDPNGVAIRPGEWLSYGLTNVLDDDELETIGAAVDQSAARALENRFLALIRAVGTGTASHVSFQFLGGDVTDALQIPNSTQKLWIGADWFAGATVVTGADTFGGPALPIRNGAIQETVPGTFALQYHRVGNTGVWMDAVADGGQAAGRIWWPLCILHDGGTTMRVGCLLIAPPDANNPYGIVEGSHIITLNAFGTYGSHINVGIAGFEIDGMWRDTTHTYIIDEPNVKPLVVLGGKTTRLARVVNGSLTTVAAWEHWNGSAWVSDSAVRAPLVDIHGNVVRGDSNIAKVGTNRYLMVAHHPAGGEFLDVYNSTLPQGPWVPIARVPLPAIGHTINGGEQITQIPRILASNILANAAELPPAEHSVVLTSRNLVGYTDAFTSINIRRLAPLPVVVPHN